MVTDSGPPWVSMTAGYGPRPSGTASQAWMGEPSSVGKVTERHRRDGGTSLGGRRSPRARPVTRSSERTVAG